MSDTMTTSSRHSWRNGNDASSGAQSRRSSAAAPITVTAFVDWKAQIHNARAADITEPRAKAGRTLKNVARIVDKVLRSRAPVRFRVAFRFYHGWHKGFEETESRKAMTGLVAETDFTNLSRSRNVRFLEEVRYGDELLTALPQRARTRPPVHLPDTWRQQEQDGSRVEKMVDTALVTDLLARACNDPHEWALVLSEDDDMVPPVFTAEAWMKPHGGRVVIVRTKGKGKGKPRKNIGGRFLKLDGLMEVVDT